MSAISTELSAEKVAALERHLRRVESKRPPRAEDLLPASDTSDAIILHLWQATQLVLDFAMSRCVANNLGTPASYADAFVRLAEAGKLERGIAMRMVKAAGWRNVVSHAYNTLDMRRVYAAAEQGPDDLRDCLAALIADA